MKTLELTVKKASELAYEEDQDQIVGRIQGEWQVAGWEDIGRINQMQQPTFCVKADGLDAYDVMTAMEKAGIDCYQDWENEITRYELDNETIVVNEMIVSFE